MAKTKKRMLCASILSLGVGAVHRHRVHAAHRAKVRVCLFAGGSPSTSSTVLLIISEVKCLSIGVVSLCGLKSTINNTPRESPRPRPARVLRCGRAGTGGAAPRGSADQQRWQKSKHLI